MFPITVCKSFPTALNQSPVLKAKFESEKEDPEYSTRVTHSATRPLPLLNRIDYT